jgi:hypothetical protein
MLETASRFLMPLVYVNVLRTALTDGARQLMKTTTLLQCRHLLNLYQSMLTKHRDSKLFVVEALIIVEL